MFFDVCLHCRNTAPVTATKPKAKINFFIL